jgi:hypothetical protein
MNKCDEIIWENSYLSKHEATLEYLTDVIFSGRSFFDGINIHDYFDLVQFIADNPTHQVEYDNLILATLNPKNNLEKSHKELLDFMTNRSYEWLEKGILNAYLYYNKEER